MSEERKIQFILGAGLLFLLSAYGSCIEFKYMLWGQSADAEIQAVRKSLTSGGRNKPSIPVLGVRYRFTEEDGTSRENIINMKSDWEVPEDNILKVDYLPGEEGESRIHGQRRYLWIVIFFGSLSTMVFIFIRFHRQAYK